MGSRGRVGSVIGGKWRIERRIGRGGMSSVYAAVHTTIGHRVAVKMLTREAAQEPAICSRFRREGKLANKVDHEGVINIIDDGVTDDGRPYLIMELLEGETLDQKRFKEKNDRLPLGEVLDVTLAVADILAAAHDAGVVHRDVKPSNIFITNEGVVKLVDFGVAGRRQTPTDEHTATGAGCGTPLFMAPEQVTGDDLIDARADVFALATTIYRLVAGQFPFPATTMAEYMRAFMMGPKPKRLDDLVPEVNAALADVIARGLSLDPKERYIDAREFSCAITKAIRPAAPEQHETTMALATLPFGEKPQNLQIDTVVMQPAAAAAAMVGAPAPSSPHLEPMQMAMPRPSMPSYPPMEPARPPMWKQGWPLLVVFSLAAVMMGLVLFAH